MPAPVLAGVPVEEELGEPVFALEEDEEEPEPAVVEVDVVLVLVLEEGVAGGALLVGTVSGGAPEVLAEFELPPPQAERPTASAVPAKRAARKGAPRAIMTLPGRTSGPEGVHPASAMGAIVEVLLAELIAPIAEAEVLDGPGQLRGRGRQGEEHGRGLEGLARLAVDVGAARLGLEHDLAPGRRGPQAVLLLEPQGRDATSGPQALHHRRLLG